ncbi:hypothetical protein J2Y38_004602 [Flavobacterium sp. 2755]|uniref:hypothetical protein n=1 Tax=Flavobacterium sp. 2755 TaxID=2817765 RepID=UPI0028554E8A|nr:hypothetical protein [Flavobacterium sp. 2755]MDR6764369.1 hypothetical protein [Flavobacterium sp. 2755]
MLKSGNYTGNSSLNGIDNLYTVVVEHKDDIITITEPNRKSQYVHTNGNTYWHTEAKYSQVFYVRVISNTQFYAGKKGQGEGLYTYQGGNTKKEEVLLSGIDNCPLYDKYLNLSQTDPIEVQAWTFCGAAALAKCTYTDYSNYLPPIIRGLKSILENVSKCPCTDVITTQEWNAVSID